MQTRCRTVWDLSCPFAGLHSCPFCCVWKNTVVYSASTRRLQLSVAPCRSHCSDLLFEVSHFILFSGQTCTNKHTPVSVDPHQITLLKKKKKKRVFLTSVLSQIVWCVTHHYWGKMYRYKKVFLSKCHQKSALLLDVNELDKMIIYL